MKAFETCHPVVLFSFFVTVIGMSMFFMHPVYLIITIFSAISLNLALRRQHFLKDWKLYVPLFFLMALINPIISHNGELVSALCEWKCHYSRSHFVWSGDGDNDCSSHAVV